MWDFINNVLLSFRKCFSRKASFDWFCSTVAAFITRCDKLGVTSFVRPLSMEMIADEALSIKSDADRWRERKRSLEANRKYNEMLNSGLGEEE